MFLESGTPATGAQYRRSGRTEEAGPSPPDFDWINRAARGLGEVERGMRRNLLRSYPWNAFRHGAGADVVFGIVFQQQFQLARVSLASSLCALSLPRMSMLRRSIL